MINPIPLQIVWTAERCCNRSEEVLGGSSGGGGGGGGGGGRGTAKSAYMITVENTKNGEVVSSHKTADKGDTVTLTATPDKGYAIRRIIVTDSSDQKLTLTEKDGKYTFTMPSSNVTVKTTFIMDKSKDEVPNPFADVSANSYYYDAVQWAVKNGTTGGTSATTFSPDAPCTRAQAVTFLWRAAAVLHLAAQKCPSQMYLRMPTIVMRYCGQSKMALPAVPPLQPSPPMLPAPVDRLLPSCGAASSPLWLRQKIRLWM